ncbi:hypothetical protein MMC24_001282 [Lignoscripta atroalba]|nr:hypothetical protein [Lignoscripta atroalba]
MTDVRSLLRNERASRRITHPQVTYSTTGTLVCLVCHIQLKSESLWDSHLKSKQHAMRLQRIRDGTLGRPPGAPESINGTNGTVGNNKKRKADDEIGDIGKRVKAANVLPEGFFDGDGNGVAEPEHEDEAIPEEEAVVVSLPETIQEVERTPPEKPSISSGLPARFFDASSKGAVSPRIINTVDEGEWAAFERDVATPPPEPLTASALTAAATISAAPLTAAEIAARSREEASTQTKERREAELEGEKEDAARQLEAEFDEMEELEERVRRLREKREEIRKRRKENGIVDAAGESSAGSVPDRIRENDHIDDGDGDADDDDDDEDWDNWGLR